MELAVSFRVFMELEVFDTMELDCTKADIIVVTFEVDKFKELIVDSSIVASCIEVLEVYKLIAVVTAQSLVEHKVVKLNMEEIKIHE